MRVYRLCTTHSHAWPPRVRKSPATRALCALLSRAGRLSPRRSNAYIASMSAGCLPAPVSAGKERIDVFSKKFALAAGVAITAGALTGAAVMPAFAHHATSVMFSLDQEVVLTGTVKGFRYSNPHSTIRILVPRGGQN